MGVPVTVFAVFMIISAVLGASMGSFINVVASRTVDERPWWGKERSSCDRCGRDLATWELIPVFSWLILRRGCRSCGARIPLRYLGVEIGGAAIGVVIAWRWGFSVTSAIAAVIASGLFLNALTDLYSGYVYDLFAWGLGGAGMLVRIGGGIPALADGVFGAFLGFAVIAVIIVASRGGMGWGDASLMAGSGAALGLKLTAWALYSGFMIGGVTALGLLALGRVKRKDVIPLGPFLALGGIVSIFTGTWFYSLFGMTVTWPWS